MNRGAVARAAALVAAFNILSRILGFVREAFLSRALGTTGEADAYANSLFIVNTGAAILLYALVTIVIPAFEHERRDRGEHSAWALMRVIGTWVCLVLIALSTLMAVWPEVPTALFRMDGESGRIMAELVRIMAAGLALQGISALLTAVLQSQRRFLGPAAVGVAFNLGIILALVIGGGTVRAASWGVVAGAIAQVVLQLPQLIMVLRRGGGGRPGFAHPRLRAAALMSLPVMGASILQQINGYTDKLFAESLKDDGQIAALNWANQAGQAPRALLLVPLLTPFFPVIARLAAEERRSETGRAFRRAADVMGLVSLPMTALLLTFPDEIARIMFGGSKCGPGCVADIAGPLRYYAIGTWAAFIGYLLNRSLSALNRPRDIFRATIVTVVVTVALDVILLGPMQLQGLALATSIGVIVNMVITGWMLARLLPDLHVQSLVGAQARIAACAAIGAATAIGMGLAIPTDGTGTITATAVGIAAKSAIGLAAFIVAARILAPAPLREGVGAVRSLVSRRRR